MGIEKIKEELRNFIKSISRVSEKKLSKDKAGNISRQASIFADLLDKEGFINESEEMKVFAVAVFKNSKVTRSQIKALSDILDELT